MSKITIAMFIIIVIPFSAISQTLYGVWTDLDGSSVFPGVSKDETVTCIHPHMVLDSKDQPHIIWQKGTVNYYYGDIYYAYF